MSDDTHYTISRRKVLGGLGAVGLASAGAGLGTSAYFNDTESFEGNALAAGRLDLKIDWQQTYDGPDGLVPINAYPDADGDGLQSFNGVQYGGPGAARRITDVPGVCCDCDDDELLLVFGERSWCIEPIRGDVSVEEFYAYGADDDFSGNPDVVQEDTAVVFVYEEPDGSRYLVVVNDTPTTDDGGFADVAIWGFETPPTWVVQDDPSSPSSPDAYTVDTDSASADWVWAADHTDGGAVGDLGADFTLVVDFAFGDAADDDEPVFDDRASIRQLDVLDGNATDRITLFDGGSDPIGDVPPLTITTDCSLESGAALDPAEVYNSPNRSADYGGPLTGQAHLVELGDVKPGDSGEITFSVHLCGNPGYVWLDCYGLSESEGGAPTEPELADDPDQSAGDLAENVDVTLWYDLDCNNVRSANLTGTEPLVVAETTLADLFATAGDPRPDGGRRVPLDGLPETPGRDCLPGDGGMCVGFAWEVPASVENEIQGDTLAFDVAFYAEQCRHNDGESATSGV